jgi:hypothetical protein
MSSEYQPRELEAAEQVFDVVQKYFLKDVTADSFPHHFLTIQKIVGNIIRHSYLYIQVDFIASKHDAARSADIHEQIELIKGQLITYFTNNPLKKNMLGVNFDDKKATERLVTILKEKQVGFSLPSTIFNEIENALSTIKQNDEHISETTHHSEFEAAEPPASAVQPKVERLQIDEAELVNEKLMSLPFENFAWGLMTTMKMSLDNVAGYFAKMSEMGRIKVAEGENELLIDPAVIWRLYEAFRALYPNPDEEVNRFKIWQFMAQELTNPEWNQQLQRNEVGWKDGATETMQVLMALIQNKVPVEQIDAQ